MSQNQEAVQAPCFQVGDRVSVLISQQPHAISRRNGIIAWRREMWEFVGRQGLITEAGVGPDNTFRIDLDDGEHYWAAEWLTPAESPPSVGESVKRDIALLMIGATRNSNQAAQLALMIDGIDVTTIPGDELVDLDAFLVELRHDIEDCVYASAGVGRAGKCRFTDIRISIKRLMDKIVGHL